MAHVPRLGSPTLQAPFYFPLHKAGDDNDQWLKSAIMCHEFLHAYIGVADEYKYENDKSRCPEKVLVPNGRCVMDIYTQPTMHLCREETHHSHTEQGRVRGMSCYSWATKMLKDHLQIDLVIPERYIHGPTDPPDPEIVRRF